MLNDPNATSESSATTLHGTGDPAGQPADAPLATEGIATSSSQPDASAQTSGEPSGEGSDGSTPPVQDAAYWEKQYKEIQSLSDKRYSEMEELKKTLSSFEPFGGPEQVLQAAMQLKQSPEFQQWLQGQQTQKYGMDVKEMDDAQKEAIDLVEKIAEEKANARFQQMKQEMIDPLIEKNVRAHTDGLFTQMDERYPEWRSVQAEMETLSTKLDPKIQSNPSLEDVEGLYMMALAKTGKMAEFGAVQYRKELEKKKLNASDTPPTNAGTANTSPSSTLADALAKAKQSHGITGAVSLT